MPTIGPETGLFLVQVLKFEQALVQGKRFRRHQMPVHAGKKRGEFVIDRFSGQFVCFVAKQHTHGLRIINVCRAFHAAFL